MATSAFRSTSKRATSSSASATAGKAMQSQSAKQNDTRNSTQKAPIRRSRSVSAFSITQLDVTLDFQNKRDNPLFWVEGSPLSKEEDDIKFSKFEEISSKSMDLSSVKSSEGVETKRGRTVSRSYGVAERRFSAVGNGGRKDSSRSLSRVDTGRRCRRSPSTGRFGNSEREHVKESGFLSDVRSQSKNRSDSNCKVPGEKKKSVENAFDFSDVLKSWNTWSNQHHALDTGEYSPTSWSCSGLPRWDDGGSTGSISEAEEKTVIPVSEVRKSVLRSNGTDIAPEFENPNAEELLRDFSGDLARELEECEERARKLRAELAAEEHREVELNQILNDITLEPKTPQVQKPRALRKASVERRKMSKCLEVEAMAYFDECISISTFDDSDFSSLEDPPSNMSRADAFGPGTQGLKQSITPSSEDPCLPTKNTCNDSPNCTSLSSSKMKVQPPFTSTQSASFSLEQDLRNYVKRFSKESKLGISNCQIASTVHQSMEGCTSQVAVEELLLERVRFRSRIESGSILLCGDSFGLLGPPYASIL